MSIGMNGVPSLPMQEEEDSEVEQEVALKAVDERESEDNRKARFLWFLKGMTPVDIKSQCVAHAKSSPREPEFQDIEWDEERESNEAFVARRSGGKAVFSGVS